MAFCSKCGTQLNEENVCPGCGSVDLGAKIQEFTNTADSTAAFDPADIQQNKAMSVLAYIGILVLIPIFAAPGSKFARFHSNQGLVLLIAGIVLNIALTIIGSILGILGFVGGLAASLISTAVFIFLIVLIILGIVNAATGKAKELPIIGKFTLIK